MVELDLDLDKSAVSAKLEQLKQKVAGDPVAIVSVGASYAVYVEFGTKHHPPYPFFRPAIREFQANPETFIEDNSDMGLDEIETAEELVTAVSSALETQMKKNVTAQAASGRSPGTHPEHPKVQTGTLRASISAKRID